MVGTYLVELARALKDRGEQEESEPLLHQALAIFRRSFPPEHPAVTTTLELLADVYRLEGSKAEALTLYQQVYEIRSRTLEPDNPQLAFSLLRVGLSQGEADDPSAAEPQLQRAVEILRQAYPPGDWRIAYAESEWAGVLLALGRGEEAKSLLRGALVAFEGAPDREAAEQHRATALERLAAAAGDGNRDP